MLRDENERNVKKVRELEDQVNHLKNNISPLQGILSHHHSYLLS